MTRANERAARDLTAEAAERGEVLCEALQWEPDVRRRVGVGGRWARYLHQPDVVVEWGYWPVFPAELSPYLRSRPPWDGCETRGGFALVLRHEGTDVRRLFLGPTRDEARRALLALLDGRGAAPAPMVGGAA